MNLIPEMYLLESLAPGAQAFLKLEELAVIENGTQRCD